MNQHKRGLGFPGLGLFLAIAALVAIPVFPVLAGKQFQNLAETTPTAADDSFSTPPALEPTSLLDYPPLSDSRPAPYQSPLQLRPEDHFWFDRPIPSTYKYWIDPDYRYGTNFNGEMSVHSGVDIPAGNKAPVLAAADGTIVWAGMGLWGHFPNPNDPYGNAISIRHDFGYLGQPVYTVYGHLSEIDVVMGQRVKEGDQIGLVGSTGKTTGPHLHFEVRVGQDSFYATKNPELWLVPPVGYGVLAGRIETGDSWPLIEYPFHLIRMETKTEMKLMTYVGNDIYPDDIYKENFVVSDLPAGTYMIQTWVWWRYYSFTFEIAPGQTTFVLIHSGLDPLINPPMTIPAGVTY
jgi:murein DD-endopeptidase MepM/ murein hydrolase activator NlpD